MLKLFAQTVLRFQAGVRSDMNSYFIPQIPLQFSTHFSAFEICIELQQKHIRFFSIRYNIFFTIDLELAMMQSRFHHLQFGSDGLIPWYSFILK